MKIAFFIIITLRMNMNAQSRVSIDICIGMESKKLFDTSWIKVLYLENDTFLYRTEYKKINNILYYSVPYIEPKNALATYERRYFREDSTGSVFIYDTLNNQETLVLPSDESMKGKEYSSKWLDGHKSFRVIDYHAQLSTPYCNYTDLIKLGEKKMNHPLDYRYFSYYKRGIGFVAKALDDDVYIFLEAMYIEK